MTQRGVFVLLLHLVPVRVTALASITDISVSADWFAWYPPWRTLRLGNRLRRRFVVIRRRGLISTLLLTPADPAAFAHACAQACERARAASGGTPAI